MSLKQLSVLVFVGLAMLPVGADEDFISHYEYGEMLYSQPRGVSCIACHGETGKGRVITEFRDIHGKEQISGPDIRSKTLEEMYNALNSYHDIMPRYYLTDEEIRAIYDFLQEKTRKMGGN